MTEVNVEEAIEQEKEVEVDHSLSEEAMKAVESIEKRFYGAE